MDKEQPILGIVATINGSDIQQGANELVNNVGRIERAADGAARSITSVFSTLQLQLVKVNEQISLAETRLASIKGGLSSSNAQGGTTDARVIELEKRLNTLMSERVGLMRQIEQQSKSDPLVSGKKVNSSYKEQLKELTRQQKEYSKQLEQSLNERARIEEELTRLTRQNSDNDNVKEVEKWQSIVEEQKTFIRNLGEIKTRLDENGNLIEVMPQGWENANAQLKVMEAHLAKLQGEDPATKQIANLESQLRRADAAVESRSSKVEQTKQAISSLNGAIADSIKQSETLTKRLRDIREQMQRMRLSGKSNTPEYAALAEEAKKISAAAKQTRADFNAQTPIFSKLTGGVTMYKELLNQLPPAISSSVKQMDQLIRVSLRFIATPLGMALAALTLSFKALSSWFNNTSDGQQAWARISGYTEGVVKHLTNRVYDLIRALRGVKDAVPKEDDLSTTNSKIKEEKKKIEKTWWTREEFRNVYENGNSEGVSGIYALRAIENQAEGDIKFYRGKKDAESQKALSDALNLRNDIVASIGNLKRIEATGFEKVMYRFIDGLIEYGNAVRGTSANMIKLWHSADEAGKSMVDFKETMKNIKEQMATQRLLDAATDAKISRLQGQLNSPYATAGQKISLTSQIGTLNEGKINAQLGFVNEDLTALANLYNIPTSVQESIKNGTHNRQMLESLNGVSPEDIEKLENLYEKQISLESQLQSTHTDTANTINQQQLELIASRQEYVTQILALDRKLANEEADILYQRNKIAIDALADSAEKRKRLREAEHQQNLSLIKREQEEAEIRAKEDAKAEYNKNPDQKRRIWSESFLNIAVGSDEYNALGKDDKGIIDRYQKAIKNAADAAKNATEQENADYLGINELLSKYQTFTMQRISLDTEYADEHNRIMSAIAAQDAILNDETAEQEKKTNAEVIKARLNDSLLALEKEKKQRKEALAGEVFQDMTKNDRLYKMATGDLNGLSADTLRILTSRLEKLKGIKDLNFSQTEQLQSLIDEINRLVDNKSPLRQLIDAESKLNELRQTELSLVTGIAKAKKSGSDTVTYTKNGETITATMQEAVDELYNIGKGIQTQKDLEEDANYKITNELSRIFGSLQNIGDQIGGDSGAIISGIGSIGNTWSSSYMNAKEIGLKVDKGDISKGAGKAMGIMQGIEAGISVGSTLTRLFESTGVSKQARYEKYAAKLNDTNELTNSLYRYRIALAATEAAEKRWFGNDPIGDLRSKWEEGHAAMEGYYKKLTESQAIYQNQSKHEGDWLGNVVVGSVAGAITGAGIGFTAGPYGAILGAVIGGIAGGVAGANTSFAEQYFNGLNYQEGQTAAMNNLRFETRAKKGSFMWIGGHNQETADLRSWAKQTYGRDLFDKKGMIDVDMAKEIISNYGHKLQGQTKATLEQLIELKEKYDEYMDQLKEYVDSLYSPLADAMTNAIWEWFDSGVDALRSFRDAAAETFRNIANDLLKTIVMKKIFGTFEDEILNLYDQMNAGRISEETLFSKVVSKTNALMMEYERQIPYLESVLTAMNEASMNTFGKGISESSFSQKASAGMMTSYSQESVDEANGRLTSLQIGQQYIIEGQQSILEQMMAQTIVVGAMATNIGTMRGDVSEIRDILYSSNEYLYRIVGYTAHLESIERSIKAVEQNTKEL